MEGSKKIDFEKSIAELNAIVEKLESDVSLEEGMRLFEQGLKLTKDCIDELNRTQENISSLKKQLGEVLLYSPGEEK
ncbi:MAG: exodeoxyribonuclease VII small subunit [Clostridiales bacterium]|nr:exodeoxyribonuclease VII small subunit [Clostridiales bacterium]